MLLYSPRIRRQRTLIAFSAILLLMSIVSLIFISQTDTARNQKITPNSQSLIRRTLSNGSPITYVHAGSNLQTAINNASPGDTLLLDAGATYRGWFTLPQKNGTALITISSNQADQLPLNTQVKPSGASHMAILASPGSNAETIKTAPGAHNYLLSGLEITATDANAFIGNLVSLGDGSNNQNTLALVPHDIEIDRSYIHAFGNSPAKRGIGLNSANTTIRNSYISGIKLVGQDSQAIGGWNGPGPYLISNNYLEGSGENLMFGGADPAIPNLIPSDIQILNNHFSKPLSWRISDPSYGGIHWTVKNLLELKNAQRVTIDGNLFEYSWADAQTGNAVTFKSDNQSGSCTWCKTDIVRFSNNIVRHAGIALVTALKNDGGQPSAQGGNVTVINNLFDDISGTRWGGGPNSLFNLFSFQNVTIDHNIVVSDSANNLILASGPPSPGLVFTNNIVLNGTYGIKGDGQGAGNSTIATYYPGASITHNVIVGGTGANNPTGNFYPANYSAVGFVNFGGADYRLATTSPYHGVSTDNTDIGFDNSALTNAQNRGSSNLVIPTPVPFVVTPQPNPVSQSTPPASSTPAPPINPVLPPVPSKNSAPATIINPVALPPTTSQAASQKNYVAAGSSVTPQISFAPTVSISDTNALPNPAATAPSSALQIISATFVDIRSDQITININTNRPITLKVEYGLSTTYGTSLATTAASNLSTLTLTHLQAATTYQALLTLTETDTSNHVVIYHSGNISFSTLAAPSKNTPAPPVPKIKSVIINNQAVLLTAKPALYTGHGLFIISGNCTSCTAGTTVVTQIHSKQEILNEAIVDSKGKWSVRINVVGLKTGSHEITLFTKTNHGLVSAPVIGLDFTVDRIALSDHLPTPLLLFLNDTTELSLLLKVLILLGIGTLIIVLHTLYIVRKRYIGHTLWQAVVQHHIDRV